MGWCLSYAIKSKNMADEKKSLIGVWNFFCIDTTVGDKVIEKPKYLAVTVLCYRKPNGLFQA
jgi:hypothetical protein